MVKRKNVIKAAQSHSVQEGDARVMTKDLKPGQKTFMKTKTNHGPAILVTGEEIGGETILIVEEMIIEE